MQPFYTAKMLDLNKILSKLFGSKSQRDLKEIEPVVELVHEASKAIVLLTNDDLRNKTAEFRERIAGYINEETEALKSLRSQA